MWPRKTFFFLAEKPQTAKRMFGKYVFTKKMHSAGKIKEGTLQARKTSFPKFKQVEKPKGGPTVEMKIISKKLLSFEKKTVCQDLQK